MIVQRRVGRPVSKHLLRDVSRFTESHFGDQLLALGCEGNEIVHSRILEDIGIITNRAVLPTGMTRKCQVFPSYGVSPRSNIAGTH